MASETTRLDVALVDRGLARSRTRAGEIITSGGVTVDGQPATKSSLRVGPEQDLVVSGNADRWVGRAAGKLVGAFEAFDLEAQGRRCLDIGACTGGFTQVLLEQGAEHVIALDVGHDQLAPEVSLDPRVEDRSGTTVRGITPEDIGGPVDLVVGDLSFISLRLVLPEIAGVLADNGEAVLLVKPQFEVGRGRVGRRGVVTSPEARGEALASVLQAAEDVGLSVLGLAVSPVRGAEGNREYLAHLTRRRDVGTTWQHHQVTISDLVRQEGP